MNHYQTLGVAKNATPDEIKKAYRKLAAQHHPDRGGDTAMFQNVQAAYDVLSDPEKRQEYDNPRPNMNGPWQSEFPGGFHFNDFDPRDIFSQMFGQRTNSFNQRPGTQIFRTHFAVTLEDIYNGKNQVLKVQTPAGSKIINIDIPKGVRENTQVKYETVIENSTLLVEFKTLPHLRFERRNDDLYCNQPISILDLITGTTIDFTTISGKTFEVKVPPKTQPYMQLKINGQGMPILGTDRYGDQILLLKPFIPDIIDDEITQSILRSKQK